MLNNRLAILLILSIVIGGLVQCTQESRIWKVKIDSLDSMKKAEDSSKAILQDKVFAQSEDLKFSYNDSTRILSFTFDNQKFILGEFMNTFDIAPNIGTKQADSSVYVIVMNKFFDLGQGFDVLTLFLFDKKQQKIKKLVETEEVGIHDMSLDTLKNIKHYDYRIDNKKKELIIEEYIPYKSLENQSFKYQIKTQKHPFLDYEK